MTDDHQAEMDAIAAQLEAAGVLRIITRPDGGTDYQPTESGVRVASWLAMSDEASHVALMDALLGATEAGTPGR